MLSADELRTQQPMLGRLRYVASPYNGRDGRGALTCLLMPRDLQNTTPLVQLFSARIKVIDERGIRIVGEEDEWRRKERTSFRQVLWCWTDDPLSTITVAPRGDIVGGVRAGRGVSV